MKFKREINIRSQFLLTKFVRNHRATGDGATSLDASLWTLCHESRLLVSHQGSHGKKARGSIERYRIDGARAVFHARYRFLHRDKQLDGERERRIDGTKWRERGSRFVR